MANSNATTTPACQRCKRPTNALVREGDRQRFECTGCGLTFWDQAIAEPASDASKGQQSFAFSPIAIPERTATDGAGPRAKCEKCGKPYINLGKRYEHHVATCDGKPYKEKVPRKRRVLLDVQSPTQVYASSIAALLARRCALEAEIRGIDSAVAEINEKMKGAGGPSPAPFPDGSPVKL